MIVSRCCKDFVNVEHDYFVCQNCGRPCDTVSAINLEAFSHDDKRAVFEGQEVIDFA